LAVTDTRNDHASDFLKKLVFFILIDFEVEEKVACTATDHASTVISTMKKIKIFKTKSGSGPDESEYGGLDKAQTTHCNKTTSSATRIKQMWYSCIHKLYLLTTPG